MNPKELFFTPEKPKSPKEYLGEELKSDLSAFSEEGRELAKTYFSGETLSPERQSKRGAVIGGWWEEKYGFPFHLKAAREETLRRKYASSEEERLARELQNEFLAAAEANDEKKIGELKNKYFEEFTGQMEGVEVLFGLEDFLKKQKNLDKETERGRIDPERFKDLTEYQFLFTHYIVQNQADKKFLAKFWNTAEAIGKRTGTSEQLNILRLGLLGQAAVYKILESLGENPRLSHPREDAFSAIDLWAGREKSAVQVKLGKEVTEPAVLKSDEIAFPAIQAKTKEQSRYYSSKYFNDSARFSAKIKKYGEMTGKNIEGYTLIIPRHKIDFITGEPAPELIDFFREKLGT